MLGDLSTYRTLLGLDVNNPGNPGNPAINTGLMQDLKFADGVIRRWTKRPYLTTATVTEYYNGNGRQDLPLYNYPVQGILGLWLDPTGYAGKAPGTPFGPSTQLVEGRDYLLNYDQPDGTSKSGYVIRLGGGPLASSFGDPWFWGWGRGSLTAQLPPVWSFGVKNIKIEYTCGYSDESIPPELSLACCELAAFFRRTKKLGGQLLLSESLADYSYSVGVQQLNTLPALGTLRQALTPFRSCL